MGFFEDGWLVHQKKGKSYEVEILSYMNEIPNTASRLGISNGIALHKLEVIIQPWYMTSSFLLDDVINAILTQENVTMRSYTILEFSCQYNAANARRN